MSKLNALVKVAISKKVLSTNIGLLAGAGLAALVNAKKIKNFKDLDSPNKAKLIATIGSSGLIGALGGHIVGHNISGGRISDRVSNADRLMLGMALGAAPGVVDIASGIANKKDKSDLVGGLINAGGGAYLGYHAGKATNALVYSANKYNNYR